MVQAGAESPQKHSERHGSPELNPVPQSLQERVSQLVHSHRFEVMTGLVICFNAIGIGLATEHSVIATVERVQLWADGGAAVTSASPPPSVFKAINYFFAACYIVELSLQLFAFRWLFFTSVDRKWNIFALFLVLAALYEMVSDTVGSGSDGTSFLTVIRLLRLLKLLRLVRLMRFFKEIRTMFLCLVGSMGTLFWTVVMMMLIMYIFALCLLQGAVACASTPTCIDDAATQESLTLYWGSVGSAMLTLYKAITGGNDWENLARPIKESGAFYFGMFLFYVLFLQFAVLNVLTGMFVDTAMAVLSGLQNEDSDFLEILNSLKSVLADASRDQDEDENCLTLAILKAHAHGNEMKSFLAACDVELDLVLRFFSNESEGGSEVDLDSFLHGCRTINGFAKSIDMMSVLHEVKHVSKMLHEGKEPGDRSSTQPFVGNGHVAGGSQMSHAIDSCNDLEALQGAHRRLEAKIRTMGLPLRSIDPPLGVSDGASPPSGEVFAVDAGPFANPPSLSALKALATSFAADLAPKLAAGVEMALAEELAPAIAKETAALLLGTRDPHSRGFAADAAEATGTPRAAGPARAEGDKTAEHDQGHGVFSGLARLYMLEALKVTHPISSDAPPLPSARRRVRHKADSRDSELRGTADGNASDNKVHV